MIIDLHTHTLLSDGSFVIAEHLHRAENAGYKYIAITDHVDFSNIEFVLPQIIKGVEEFNKTSTTLTAFAGVEITHVHPSRIKEIVELARKLGAYIIAVHGESIIEEVHLGTNRAAIEAKVDFLAHPGVIDEEDVILAAKQGVFLEISSRSGNALGNGRVVSLARKHNAPLIINSDAHHSRDFYTEKKYLETALGAGLTMDEFGNTLKIINDFIASKL